MSFKYHRKSRLQTTSTAVCVGDWMCVFLRIGIDRANGLMIMNMSVSAD